jgi:hypothetical protein
MTPPILYQTWKTREIPPNMMTYRQKWLNMTPQYEHPLLDDQDLRSLVETHFPHYLELYDSFTHNIERVDFARYIMMYLGGVYADLDTYPIKPIDKWVQTGKIVLGREPLEHAHEIYKREVVLCNAFMISPPKKQFWIDFMDYIMDHYEHNSAPVYTTGPMAMTKFYEDHPERFNDVIITDPCIFFPMTGKGKISEWCSLDKDSYVVHVWTNTWVTKWYEDPRWLNTRYWFYILLVVFVLLWSWLYSRKFNQ